MLRKAAIGALVLVGVLVALLAGAFGLAQTGFAKQRIAALVASRLGTAERPAEVAGLDGFLPFDIRVARLALRDDKGAWLEVDDARLKLAPADLLKGQVRVAEVGAGRVRLDHLPPPGPPAPPSDEPFSLPELPQLPESLPVTATIDRLHVDSIELGSEVLGQPAIFNLEGSAGTGDGGKRPGLDLRLRRTDQATASLDLAAGLDLAARSLRLRLDGTEAGGLVAALTKRPEAGDLHLSLAGDGPLDGWKGRLEAGAERLARLDATIDLAYAAERRIGIDGALTVDPGLLPPDVAPVLGERATFGLAARETEPGTFRLDQLALAAGAIDLKGAGSADARAQTVDAGVTLAVPRLADLAALAGVPLAGAAEVRLHASGRLDEPALRLDLAGTDITAQTAHVAHLSGGYDIATLKSAEGAIAGGRVAGTLTTDGLSVDGHTVGRATLEAKVEAPPTGAIKVVRLALTSDPATLSVTGAVDRTSLAGELRLQAAVPDLATIAALAPKDAGLPPLKGGLTLEGGATLGENADSIDARLVATARDLAGLPPGAQELAGAAPRLEIAALVEHKAAVTVRTLRLDGAALTLDGNPSLSADRKLAGDVTLQLPDLAKLSAVAGQPVAGRLTAKVGLGGDLGAPAVALDATGDGLRFGDQGADRLRLTGRAAGPLASPSGDLALAATRSGQQLALAADYALGDKELRLPRIELTGPGTRLGGEARVDLARLVATGKLSGGVGDLAALSAWTQQRLAGAVDLDATFGAPGGRQDADLRVDAKGIAGDFGRLDKAGLTAAVRDAKGTPRIDAALDLAAFSRPDLEVRQARLTAAGPLDRLDLRLDTDGRQGQQPFDVRTEAQVAALGADKSVLLRSLAGDAMGQRIELAGPARLAMSGGVTSLDQLDLKMGPARLLASGRYGGGEARGEVRLASTPLAFLEDFGAPALEGTAEATARLSGTTRAPVATVDVTVSKLQPGGSGPRTPATDLALNARAGDGRLDAKLTAKGLGDGPFEAQAALPLRLALEPFALDLRQDAPLSGSVRGVIDLARVAAVAALDRQSAAGRLSADLRLDGTLAAPQLGGAVRLRDGRVDDLTSGASLRGLTLTAEASGRRIDLTELSGTDRRGGRLGGRGSASLDADLRPAFDLALSLARTRLLDGDLGTAVVSGDTTVKGDALRTAVRSRLRIDEADIKIPDKTGVTIPELDVGAKGAPQAPAAADGPPPYPIDLDVGVDLPERIFVRGRGLDSEWGGALTVRGDARQPDIRGDIKARRGFLDLLNQRFAIKEGVVSFGGGSPPMPFLRLEAGVKTAEVQAIVRLSGPATNPKMELTSDPVLPQDQVLSRVLFGRDVTQITPIQGIQLAAAVKELQGGGSTVGGVLDAVRKATGLDTLNVDSGTGQGDASASAGKYLSDNVYLEVQQGVQPGSAKARVEVQITPNLSVGTNVNQQSQTGVDLQWRYDY